MKKQSLTKLRACVNRRIKVKKLYCNENNNDELVKKNIEAAYSCKEFILNRRLFSRKRRRNFHLFENTINGGVKMTIAGM